MALSNWLTRAEWNGVYFAGFGEIIEGKPCQNLGDQMRLGIAALIRCGYTFRGIDADLDGNYTKVIQVCEGNETVLAEMIGGYGGFDKVGRAKEALDFFEKDSPQYDSSWLKDALRVIETGDQESSVR